MDINLCLEANYPEKLKPKVYIRQAECFKKMGESAKMRKTLMDLLDSIDKDVFGLSIKESDKYRTIISSLIVSKVDMVFKISKKLFDMPNIEENPKFLGASTAVFLKYNKPYGLRPLAKRAIDQGEVLFVEKAYAYVPMREGGEEQLQQTYCQYCAQTQLNLIPCKVCVKYLYCNESCRQNAWSEFHQWECLAIQTKFFHLFQQKAHLALRIAFKAALAGFPTTNVSKETFVSQFGNRENNYPYVISCTRSINTVPKIELMVITAVAAMLVGYLKVHTDFFEQLKQMPSCKNISEKELNVKMGGSILRNLITTTGYYIKGYNCINLEKGIPKLKEIALAVYPSCELIKHSCLPNTTAYCIGDVMIVKAIRSIRKNEEIVMSHLNNTAIAWPNEKRLKKLEENDIKCNCDACRNPKSREVYNCVKCNGPAFKINPHFCTCICFSCDYTFVIPFFVQIQEEIAIEAFTKFIWMGDIEDANRCLQIANRIFKPTHSMFDQIYDKVFDYYFKKENINCLIVIMKQHLYHLSLVYPNTSSMCLAMAHLIYIEICSPLLKKLAPEMSKEDLCDSICSLRELMEETRLMLDLHCPPLLCRLLVTEKQLLKIEKMHLDNTNS